uniref:HAT C-terminal dimerisation domain-containing protein n=1 Tax=Amphimedon queenslandica TaxID=400682 RepID=A0A1X7VQX6_AMPQE
MKCVFLISHEIATQEIDDDDDDDDDDDIEIDNEDLEEWTPHELKAEEPIQNLPEYLETQKLVQIFGRTRFATEVKAKLRSLLPLEPDAAVLPSPESANKKHKLLDFSSAITSGPKSIDGTSAEIQNYLDQPLRDINPITFWAESENTPLSQLALQLLSVPSSSAPVELLFQKQDVYLINAVLVEEVKN